MHVCAVQIASFPVSTPSFFFACCKKSGPTCEKKLGVETGNEATVQIHIGSSVHIPDF